MATAVEAGSIPSLTPNDCLVKPGFVFAKNWAHILNVPVVAEVGEYVRVGGGYMVPVKYRDGWFRRGRCALLHYRHGTSLFRFDTVTEHISRNSNVQMLLARSMRVPKVVRPDGSDPGTLHLLVSDEDTIDGTKSEIMYLLKLNDILGNNDKPDEFEAYSWG